jgi:hypothetical protein
MTSFLPGAAFTAALTIAAPVWAQGIEISIVTPGTVQRPPPEIGPGGVVVLRGSPLNSKSPLAPGTSGEGYELTGYYQPIFLNYGGDLRFDGNFDTGGLDRTFDRSGLTR